ncbi:DUF1062 domain-containing protein [Anaerocolumna sp. AGMB13025]|uniref:DUF1062 domain-containing protein n=1 Tax=Anaerocolumna sp. AGMB13025 TaxID=3039116 RepID=UPI00241E44AC|nr:DUF1062 domain-containing protein [Anaerocolumna sp. AGMB13025]WFR57111.1 DUF1062 domain-containing protein [Anaerocolumna sp. AGMB13025]
MSKIKEIIWMVKPKTTFNYISKCSKCNRKMDFYNSKKFRINANQKLVDVWLIYRCTECDTTWNIPIYDRVSPKKINPEIYKRLLANDEELAWEYSFNKDVIRNNSIQVNYENIEFDLVGEHLTEEDIINNEYDMINIYIKSQYLFDIKVLNVLKVGCDFISRSMLSRLIENGIVSGITLKEKIKDNQCITVVCNKYRNLKLKEKENLV